MTTLKINNIIISDTRVNKTRDIIIESEHYRNVHIGDIFTCEEKFHLQVISVSSEKDILIPVGNWRYRKYTNENTLEEISECKNFHYGLANEEEKEKIKKENSWL